MKVVKKYTNNMIYVEVSETADMMPEILVFRNEREMRMLGECLRDLARIGGHEVEIV